MASFRQLISVILFFLLFTPLATAQRDFPFIFNNGEQQTLSLYNEIPENISKNNYVIGMFKFSVIEKGAIGPFLLDFKYQRVMKENKNIFETFFTLQPIDSRFLEQDKIYSYKLMNCSLGATGKSYFTVKNKYKKKSLNILSSESYNTYYRVKATILVQHRYGVRYGIMYNQGPTTVYPAIVLGEYKTFDPTAQKVICFNLGISKAKYINFDYSFSGHHDKTSKVLGEIYLDLLLSPAISLYGSTQEHNPNNGYFASSQGKLTGGDKKLTHPIYAGVRFGGQLRTLFQQSKRVGSFFSYEFAFYPGLKDNNIVISVGYGLTIWGNNKF
jgi:hypothetical protein